jgi:hypothetical protein
MTSSMPPHNQQREPTPKTTKTESPVPPTASRSVRPETRAKAKTPESKPPSKPRADGPHFPLLTKTFSAAKLLIDITVVVDASENIA